MAATAERALLLAVVATAATVLLHSIPQGAAAVSAGAPQNNTEFIRQSCSVTLYRSLCYTSLAGYANAIAQDPIQLARVATNVSHSRVRSVSAHVVFLYRAAAARSMDKRTASALKDCEQSLGDATALTRQATAELRLLPTAQGPEVGWRVSNAQTWMSAALTNEDTCTDGFPRRAPGTSTEAVKADVCGRVRLAKHYTSNALALVNSLVGSNP